MKKNIRSIIAVLLIIFSFTFLFENSFINNINNNGISVYSDDDTNKNSKYK